MLSQISAAGNLVIVVYKNSMMSAEKLAPFKEMMLTLSHVGVSIPPLTPTTIDNDGKHDIADIKKQCCQKILSTWFKNPKIVCVNVLCSMKLC